ncbi:MAG: type II toxin-antitoxin system VapC family toxin [Rhodospirillaceae bacterium]|nr:type II toxin-antitoxin system VapC family toxin [Rhodospirillaceae bacterium]
MIAVDTSALMAIALNEPKGAECLAVLKAEASVVISAGTLAEALIVAEGRGLGAEMGRLVDDLNFEVAALTAASARRVAEAHKSWGRGFHKAALNYGDCFAYAVAKERGCRLLYVGKDFSKTDIKSAL